MLELLGSLGNAAAEEVRSQRAGRDQRPEDRLDPVQLRVFDALPLHTDADPSQLCRVSGLGPGEVLTSLAQLRELGLATDSLLGWRRVGSPHGRMGTRRSGGS